MLAFLLAPVIICLVRLLAYTAACHPPISIVGRLVTRRFIIPGYDYVLIAPLCIALTAALGLAVTYVIGPAYYVVTIPCALAAQFIVALNMGPSLRHWHLTGHHRIVYLPFVLNDPKKVRL
jgi:hypothetical protein